MATPLTQEHMMTRPHKLFQPRQSLTLTLLALVMLLSIGGVRAASAHSFNTSMLVPASATNEPQLDELMLAFLLASEERDSHPDETSNGHLGGLDVYITITSSPAQISAASPDIIATPLAGITMPDIPGTAFLTAPDMTSDTAITMLATPADPSLPPFAQRFKAATGHAPGPEARAIYVSARLIGRAVRKAGGVADLALHLRLLSP
jgi:hypothetical protein